MAAKGLAWHGWHSFRRGLERTWRNWEWIPKVIQAIPRHGNMQVTLEHYVKTHERRLFGYRGFQVEPFCGRDPVWREGAPQAKSRSRRAGDGTLQTVWRRERDSNPRYPFGYSGFQDRLFQPLTHPSVSGYQVHYKTALLPYCPGVTWTVRGIDFP